MQKLLATQCRYTLAVLEDTCPAHSQDRDPITDQELEHSSCLTLQESYTQHKTPGKDQNFTNGFFRICVSFTPDYTQNITCQASITQDHFV